MSREVNGFRIRGLNQDCDKLAVQSSEETTWLLGFTPGRSARPKWHDVALQRNEIKVLRPYGGQPVIELEALGDKAGGVLIVDQTQTKTRGLRVGSRMTLEFKKDEAVVLRCEWMEYPKHSGAKPGDYGQGLRV